jgi:hypothetical protein
MEKGSVFEYEYMYDEDSPSYIYYIMYIDDNLYYYVIDGCFGEASFFTNLEIKKMKLLFKIRNIDEIGYESTKKILLSCKNILRENLINVILSQPPLNS